MSFGAIYRFWVFLAFSCSGALFAIDVFRHFLTLGCPSHVKSMA